MTSFNEKQLQIIETAEQLFSQKGYDGASVRDIAEAAGINVAMISYYFGSKEKLLEAVFEVKLGRVQMRVEELLKDHLLTPLEKVNTLVDEQIDRIMKSQSFFKIMNNEQLCHNNTALSEKLKQLKMRNTELFIELVKEGQKKGGFRKKVDVVMLQHTLVGTVWHCISSKEHYMDFYQNGELSAEAYDNLLRKKLSTHIKSIFKALLTDEA